MDNSYSCWICVTLLLLSAVRPLNKICVRCFEIRVPIVSVVKQFHKVQWNFDISLLRHAECLWGMSKKRVLIRPARNSGLFVNCACLDCEMSVFVVFNCVFYSSSCFVGVYFWKVGPSQMPRLLKTISASAHACGKCMHVERKIKEARNNIETLAKRRQSKRAILTHVHENKPHKSWCVGNVQAVDFVHDAPRTERNVTSM